MIVAFITNIIKKVALHVGLERARIGMKVLDHSLVCLLSYLYHSHIGSLFIAGIAGIAGFACAHLFAN